MSLSALQWALLGRYQNDFQQKYNYGPCSIKFWCNRENFKLLSYGFSCLRAKYIITISIDSSKPALSMLKLANCASRKWNKWKSLVIKILEPFRVLTTVTSSDLLQWPIALKAEIVMIKLPFLKLDPRNC